MNYSRLLTVVSFILIVYLPAQAKEPSALCRVLAANRLPGEIMVNNLSNVTCSCTDRTDINNNKTTNRVNVDLTTILDCYYWLEIEKIKRETGYVGWDSLPVPQRDPF